MVTYPSISERGILAQRHRCSKGKLPLWASRRPLYRCLKHCFCINTRQKEVPDSRRDINATFVSECVLFKTAQLWRSSTLKRSFLNHVQNKFSAAFDSGKTRHVIRSLQSL